MDNAGSTSADVESWTLVNYLEEGGFPALLWDTLRNFGYTTYPEYSTRELTPKFGKESDLWVQLDEESVWRKEGLFRCIRQKDPWSAICFRSAREQLS
jgi:hypothetical protein